MYGNDFRDEELIINSEPTYISGAEYMSPPPLSPPPLAWLEPPTHRTVKNSVSTNPGEMADTLSGSFWPRAYGSSGTRG